MFERYDKMVNVWTAPTNTLLTNRTCAAYVRWFSIPFCCQKNTKNKIMWRCLLDEIYGRHVGLVRDIFALDWHNLCAISTNRGALTLTFTPGARLLSFISALWTNSSVSSIILLLCTFLPGKVKEKENQPTEQNEKQKKSWLKYNSSITFLRFWVLENDFHFSSRILQYGKDCHTF